MREEWEISLSTKTAIPPSPSDESKLGDQISASDAYCFELLSMVLALSGSSVGRVYVAQQAVLLQDLLSLLHTGTPRVQRQVCRVAKV